ncbi:MAG: hypothetical protein KatS3mg068_1033 [Candidatus Sericytochromatia bacterium]|nr:MAG: hypothetical protein KatS3mg068_1033 [Candidatus Sericytochromatia bacterium]
MSINLFIDSILDKLENFKNLKDLFDFAKIHQNYIPETKIFFQNNSKIIDIFNNNFLKSLDIQDYSVIELNNKSRILISSNQDIQKLTIVLKICIENIKLNKRKSEIKNIEDIINFTTEISNFSTSEKDILDYALGFCSKIFNSENLCVLLYNNNEAIITNSYKNTEVIGLGYLIESKLGQTLEEVFNNKKAIKFNSLNVSSEIYNSLGQLSYIFNKDKTILTPLYKNNLKIGILVINIDNLPNTQNEIYYFLTSIGKIISNNLYNIKKYNDLDKNNNYLSNLIKTSKDAIISLDISGNINIWNEGAKNIFEYEEEEIIGKSMFNLFSSDTRLKVRTQWVEVLNGKNINGTEGFALKKKWCKISGILHFFINE